MLKIFITIILIVTFHIIGRSVAHPKTKLLYNYINKIKINGYSTNIIKNYIGNIIAIFGLIIAAVIYFGITNLSFYFCLIFLLSWAFIRHIADVTEKDIPVIINGLFSGKIRNNNLFMKITLVFILSLTTSGLICTNLIYPSLNKVFTNNIEQKTENDKPLSEIIEEIENNSKQEKNSEELLLEQIDDMLN